MTVPLDQWIEESGLKALAEEHLDSHLTMFGITDAEDRENCIRCIMISLRQELEENDWVHAPALEI